MPENTIAQNLPIFYSAGPYTLTTPAGVTVATQSNPAVAPPSTTSEQDNPNNVIVGEAVGAQHY
jgi:hypothetical protein